MSGVTKLKQETAICYSVGVKACLFHLTIVPSIANYLAFIRFFFFQGNFLDSNTDISTAGFNRGGSRLSDCEPDLSGSA